MRTQRTNGITTYNYVYNGSQLTRMTKGAHTMDFTYDASGSPLSVIHNGVTYYYVTNLQGDVVSIVNAQGVEVVTYSYDAWGNVLTTDGSMAMTLGHLNPLRYRGYVYDPETELYYLQSRYYDPQVGRFINADAIVSTGQDLLGNNMFAYCGNNPVSRRDPIGLIWEELKEFFQDIGEDILNYDEDNEDEKDVYESNYFSSYKGTFVIRHNNDFLTSWAIGGVIFLNHNLDDTSKDYKTDTLKHEYGHIKQEQEYGTGLYLLAVAIPSVSYNLASRENALLNENYYNMPWEYNADVRGGVDRGYADWAASIADFYFGFWEWF